jgi:precorrin-2 methylase
MGKSRPPDSTLEISKHYEVARNMHQANMDNLRSAIVTAHNAALEEAAKVAVENIGDPALNDYTEGWNYACSTIAQTIRELKSDG